MSYVTQYSIVPRQRLRAELLEANRAIASWLGLDPRYTVSSNIALAVARRTGASFELAKRWFHGGVAGFLAAMFRVFGVSLTAMAGIGAVLYMWLESFDGSARLR